MQVPIDVGHQDCQLPFVSVIMPVRNEQAHIANTIASVLRQDYPQGLLEMIIVDGQSSDDTRRVVTDIIESHPKRYIRLLDNPGRIVPTGFNRALALARGDVIVRVDGHCELAPDYVRRCVDLLRTTGADNVGGMQLAIGETVAGMAIARATSSPFGVGNARFHYASSPGWVDTVYLGCYRRDVFERIGVFDEEMVRNQDDEFNFRLTQSGGRIWLDPQIKTKYTCRSSIRALLRQYFQYGVYKVRVMQKRRGVASWRQLVPGMFVVASVASILASVTLASWIFASVVLGPYLVVNCAMSVHNARSNWHLLPYLLVVFPCLHVGYGTGFLAGLWRWRHKFSVQEESVNGAAYVSGSEADYFRI